MPRKERELRGCERSPADNIEGSFGTGRLNVFDCNCEDAEQLPFSDRKSVSFHG